MIEEFAPRRKKGFYGYAAKIGTERKPHKPQDISADRYIEVCLNCTEPKCRGDCKKVHGGKKI